MNDLERITANVNGCACITCYEDCRRRCRQRVCDDCWLQLSKALSEISELHALLGLVLDTNISMQLASGTRGSPDPQTPVRLDVLDLSMPATTRNAGVISDPHKDQIGLQPVAAILNLWVRDWIETQDNTATQPLPTVPSLSTWLKRHLTWASKHHPGVAEFAIEIRRLQSALRLALNVSRRRIRLNAPCPYCDVLALTRDPAGGEHVECASCRTKWTEDEYQLLTRVLAAELQETA